jgi:acetoin utilization protein AcuB
VVAGVMSRPPEVVGPEDEVAAACAQMVARKIGCLPVVDETGALVGIVTKSDLLGRQMTTELAGATPSAARVSLAMRRDPASVPVRAPLLEAVAIMVDRDVRHVVVTDDERHVLGIVSDRDVRTAIGDPLEALHQELTEVDEMKVADVMTTDVVTVPERKPLEEVARLFMDGRIGAVPVVDDGRRLVGIVSYVDVLRALLAPDGR